MAERNSPLARNITAEDRPGGLIAVCFQALGGPCEVLLATSERSHALELGTVAAREAWRIEQKFSRYRTDSVIADIHRQRGGFTTVDPETASLLDFAEQCYRSSEGLFDITSGVLRAVWHFDGSDRVPGLTEVARVLPLVGFSKVQWRAPRLLLPVGSLLLALSGTWFVLGPSIWPIYYTARVFASAAPVRSFAEMVAYNLGVGVLLSMFAGVAGTWAARSMFRRHGTI